MAGVSQYTRPQVMFVLHAVLAKTDVAMLIATFKNQFHRSINENQIRYVKNKYGRDPSYG